MRVVLAAATAAAILSPAVLLAEEEKIDAGTLAAVTRVATKGYHQPATASVRNIHKSKARNGLGYCGEVSLETGTGFTLFHAILAGKDNPASVLRLADYPDGGQNRNAVAVRRLMANFGCLEPEPVPETEPDTR
jgi:hypothetical protein